MKKIFVLLVGLLVLLTACPQKPYTIKIENKSPYDCLCEFQHTDGDKNLLVKSNTSITKTTYYFIHLSDKSKRFYLDKYSIEHLIIKSKPINRITVENKTAVQQTISSVPFFTSEREERLKFCLFPDTIINPSETKDIDIFYNSIQEIIGNVFIYTPDANNPNEEANPALVKIGININQNKIIIEDKVF